MSRSDQPSVAVIIGPTRDARFADKPAQWICDVAAARGDMEVELVDIRDFNLPFFNEKASNLWMPSEDPNATEWQKKIGSFDGYIFVTSEYNRSIPASLKNALDQAYMEWNRKPAAIVAYGATGGAFAAGHLREIAIELQMVNVRGAVHIGGSEFFKVHPIRGNAPMTEIEEAILPGAKAMLDDLVWWARLTKQGREEAQAEAA